MWNLSIEKNEYKDGKYIGYLPGYQSLSLKKDKLKYRNINYILMHKVNKKMFRIKINDDYVDVTEDHSIIVKRDNTLISLKVTEIKNGDKLIKLVKNI